MISFRSEAFKTAAYLLCSYAEKSRLLFYDRSAVGRTDHPRIARQIAGLYFGGLRPPLAAPLRHLIFIDFQMNPFSGDIDVDNISFADEGDRATLGRFR
jgi:hypothetical protein